MHVSDLRCFRCARSSPFDPDAYLCPHCGPESEGEDPAVLDVRYRYEEVAPELRERLASGSPADGIARYLPLLPLQRLADLPRTGGTPLIPAPRLAAELGLGALYLKDETRNPTSCLKDRATAIGVSMALEAGKGEMVCASAGNAAISLAGYCAHQGLECHAYVPARASAERLEWLTRFGARVHRSEGDYDQAFAESEEAREERGWYSRNCAFNPFLVEGKKTVAWEMAEQLGWKVPDLVVAPVGDGCTLGAIGKGFREVREMGFSPRTPRLVGVQAEAVQPLVARWNGAPERSEAGVSRAASIAVSRPRNALRLLDELRRADGVMLAEPDDRIEQAQRDLATQAGVVAEFTSAATLAALRSLAQREDLAGRSAVLVITGARQ